MNINLSLIQKIGYALEEILWVTDAAAPAWLGEAGLAVDEDGFVKVTDCLNSPSHKDIFAAGDIAAVIHHPRPKAGVFAVRQGMPLAKNLRNALLSRKLKPFIPQRMFLSLISTGDKKAVASKGEWCIHGGPVWRIKDLIDRRFMRKYNSLPSMTTRDELDVPAGLASRETLEELSAVAMRCGGCGALRRGHALRRMWSQGGSYGTLPGHRQARSRSAKRCTHRARRSR